MARCVAMIVLSAVQEQQLTAWARAAKTPQRLARRARVILGSARWTRFAQTGTPAADESNHRSALAYPVHGRRL